MACPKRETDQTEEPREAVGPVAEVGQEAKQHLRRAGPSTLAIEGRFCCGQGSRRAEGFVLWAICVGCTM